MTRGNLRPKTAAFLRERGRHPSLEDLKPQNVHPQQFCWYSIHIIQFPSRSQCKKPRVSNMFAHIPIRCNFHRPAWHRTCVVTYIYFCIQVVPGRAGGGSFKREENYKPKKEFAHRMRARRRTSAMPPNGVFAPTSVQPFYGGDAPWW